MSKDTTEEVVFYAPKNARLAIGANAIVEEQRFTSGMISQPSGYIQFEDGCYRTSDPAEIEHIKKTKSFALGTIKIISETDLTTIYARKSDAQNLRIKAGLQPVEEITAAIDFTGTPEPLNLET